MPNIVFTARDRQLARAAGISLDDAPAVLESAYDALLRSHDRLETECAQAHCDAKAARAERDHARQQRNALGVLCAGSLLAWAFTLWMDSRLIP